MKKEYEMFEFKYVCKKTKENLNIYARNEDKADSIVDIYNKDREELFERKRVGFKKKILVNIEPEVLENQQIDTIEQKLNNGIIND